MANAESMAMMVTIMILWVINRDLVKPGTNDLI